MRTSALGDVLLATPALAALRRAFPQAVLDFATSPAYAPLFAGHPALSAVVPLDRAASVWRVARGLRQPPYDVFVDLQHKVRTVMLGLLARPARRLAFIKRRGRDRFRALTRRPLALSRHTADLYVDVLAPLGVPALTSAERRLHVPVQPEAAAHVEAWLRAQGLADARLIALAPGAAHFTKRWGAQRFAALGQRAQARDLGVALGVGGPPDADAMGALSAAGVLCAPSDFSLVELAALLARARVLVVGDTGPQHLAAAVGTPVVSLFGPTNPQRWAPIGVPHRVLRRALPCMPCSDYGQATCPIGTHACMRELTPDEVHAALEELVRALDAGTP